MSRLLAVATLLAALLSLGAAPQAPGLELPGLPTVAKTTPEAGAVDVARSTKPSATFTLPMDAATITEKSFTLSGPGGVVPAAVSYDALSNTAQLAPLAPLDAGATYAARLDPSVASLAGVILAEAVAWTFTVLPPPAVLTTTPIAGAVGVDYFVRPAVTFTQPMDPASINRSTFTIAEPGGTPLPTNVAYSPLAGYAMLVPLYPLGVGKTYVLTLSKDVRAADGTALAAPVSWELTTSTAGYTKRVESGGAAYVTLDGVRYDPEGTTVKGGLARVSASPIGRTNDDLLYQTERYGLWSYVFSVPNGTYTLRTHHVETLKTASRQRIFGIDVLETIGVDAPGVDLYALAGRNNAYTRTFTVTTTTSRIQVRALAVYGDPQISAIEVVPQAPAAFKRRR